MDTPEPTPRADHRALLKPLVAIRLLITGGLMGLANLVPGVSGGTMVLVMGFYDEFINSIADATDSVSLSGTRSFWQFSAGRRR